MHPLSSVFEKNIPSVFERLEAMQQCADAGYPIRAVIMPIIPVNNWQDIYAGFLNQVLKNCASNSYYSGPGM